MAKEAKEKFGKERWDEYLKFSIVRNPWDLVVSNYFFPWFHKDGKTVDFKTWLTRWRENPVWRNSVKANAVPQLNAISINNKIVMDYIIRYETLNEQWKDVANMLGANTVLENDWNHRLEEHSYLKERKDYTFYYDDDLRRIVARRYKKDIDYFGYKFGENIVKK